MAAFVKRLSMMATYYKGDGFDDASAGTDKGDSDIMFARELELIKKYGTLDLPPSAVLRFRDTGRTKRLECAGFVLTDRYLLI